MRTKRLLGILFGNILCLLTNAALAIIALWVIIPVFFEGVTIDSVVARFGMASACIANLFSKYPKIKILLFMIAFILIAVATLIYNHRANNI